MNCCEISLAVFSTTTNAVLNFAFERRRETTEQTEQTEQTEALGTCGPVNTPLKLPCVPSIRLFRCFSSLLARKLIRIVGKDGVDTEDVQVLPHSSRTLGYVPVAAVRNV
jgi:hypothetical protein